VGRKHAQRGRARTGVVRGGRATADGRGRVIVGILDLLAGCAFDISHVERVPTTFQPAVADGSGWTLPHEQSIGVGSGFATTLRRDTRWHLVGHIPQGDVYKTSDQIVTVEASGRRYNPRSS
jgi:hypothetical protein